MPKKKIVNQVYEIAVAASKPVTVRATGVLVVLTQGPDGVVVLDLPAWLALCGLRDVVRPKRARKAQKEAAHKEDAHG